MYNKTYESISFKRLPPTEWNPPNGSIPNHLLTLFCSDGGKGREGRGAESVFAIQAASNIFYNFS